jgi:hypothetical protein
MMGTLYRRSEMRWEHKTLIILGILLLSIFCFLPTPTLAYEMQLTVTVGNKMAVLLFEPISLPVPAFLQDGEVMAPISLWVKAKQGVVSWNEEQRMATVTTWQGVLRVTAGEPMMTWNGTATALPTTPTLVTGTLCVPLRSLAAACGDRWEWKGGSRELVIRVTRSNLSVNPPYSPITGTAPPPPPPDIEPDSFVPTPTPLSQEQIMQMLEEILFWPAIFGSVIGSAIACLINYLIIHKATVSALDRTIPAYRGNPEGLKTNLNRIQHLVAALANRKEAAQNANPTERKRAK